MPVANRSAQGRPESRPPAGKTHDQDESYADEATGFAEDALGACRAARPLMTGLRRLSHGFRFDRLLHTGS
jgi:hypothetical protein